VRGGIVSREPRLKEPKPEEYGPAEMHYLRDWKRWAEQELRGYRSWEASVNEALNTGDGSYRP
jgi:hypothetical protein